MHKLKKVIALAMALLMLAPASVFASSHREAPITALDRTADITDWYAFVSYDHPDRRHDDLECRPVSGTFQRTQLFPVRP